MTYGQISWLCLPLCLLTAAACSGASESVDAGACENEPACTCGDGLKGTKVCDLDTHQFVMCLCNRSRSTGALDAGVAAQGGGRTSAAPGGRPSAAQGGDEADEPAAGSPGDRGGSGSRDDRSTSRRRRR